MTSIDAARALAETVLAAQCPDLWRRAQRAAVRGRELAEGRDVDRDLLMAAALLHPIGASPVVRRTGDARADAARYLAVRGHDADVVALVGGTATGATAAALRQCLDELDAEALREPPPGEPDPNHRPGGRGPA